jgi:hypothetical protein
MKGREAANLEAVRGDAVYRALFSKRSLINSIYTRLRTW